MLGDSEKRRKQRHQLGREKGDFALMAGEGVQTHRQKLRRLHHNMMLESRDARRNGKYQAVQGREMD